MFSLCKKFFLTALIATLGLGVVGVGLAVVGGPERSKAVLQGVHTRVTEMIDEHIDDPIALRNQLRELERTYPERISAVRSDLVELQSQARQLRREKAISHRVVALAEEDLTELMPRLEEAHAVARSQGGNDRVGFQLVSLRFSDGDYSLDRADAKVRQIKNTRSAHAARAHDAERSLAYLGQQLGRFTEVLNQLESEQVQFQAQLFALNRQVDSIQRNERLIEMLAERKRTLDECSNYDVVSLDQVTGKLEQILTLQEAELDVLSSQSEHVDYVDRARDELRAESTVDGAGYGAIPRLPLPDVGESSAAALEVAPLVRR
jgi:chromosome segregation ATPase